MNKKQLTAEILQGLKENLSILTADGKKLQPADIKAINLIIERLEKLQ